MAHGATGGPADGPGPSAVFPPPIRSSDPGESCLACGVARDALFEREFLRAVLDTLVEGIVACDADGMLTVFNRAARELHGVGPMPLPPEERPAFYGLFRRDGTTPLDPGELPLPRALAGEVITDADLVVRSVEGETHAVKMNARPVTDAEGHALGAVVALHDVCDQRSLEEQVRHAQRLESLGRLTGSVVHEFNNLLTTILGNSEILLANAPAGSVERQQLEDVQGAAERAARLARQLLRYGRREASERPAADLNDAVRGIDRLLQRLLGPDVALEIDLAPGLPAVDAEPTQVEHALMNLAANARDAMGGRGRLRVATRLAPAREGGAPRAQLEVSDTGSGIPSDVLPHIFEPFFTTKGPGRGTGLGLATVYGIVRQSGAEIDVETEAGKGTCFRILFPPAV